MSASAKIQSKSSAAFVATMACLFVASSATSDVVTSLKTFPPPGASMETPASVQLLTLSALLGTFGALVRSANAENDNAKKEKKDAEEKKTIQLICADGIAFRLAVGTFLMALREAVGPLMTAVRAASTSFPSAAATMETSVSVQLMAM